MTRPVAADADALLDRARRLLADVADRDPVRRVLLGVTGSPGAGKSTLAAWLVARLGSELGPERVAHVPMDGFHLADVALDRLGRRDRKGAPDTFDAAGYAALLARLVTVGPDPVWAPAFERDLEQPLAGAIEVGPDCRLVVTEGNYLLLDAWAEARARLTEVWSCEPDEQRRQAQLIARHEEFGKSPDAARAWALGSDEANARLTDAARQHADLVVPEGVLRALGPRPES